MNHTQLADYLFLGDTKTKAKSVGNIITKLTEKNYLTKNQTHNFNGKNGGSSVTITVNEIFLEQQLHKVFNGVAILDHNTTQATPVVELAPKVVTNSITTLSNISSEVNAPTNTKKVKQSNDDFLAELEAMEDEPAPILNLPALATLEDEELKDEVEDYGYMEIESLDAFKNMLQHLKGKKKMMGKLSTIDYMIDNEMNYDLEKMKGAFEVLVLK